MRIINSKGVEVRNPHLKTVIMWVLLFVAGRISAVGVDLAAVVVTFVASIVIIQLRSSENDLSTRDFAIVLLWPYAVFAVWHLQ